MSALRLLEQLAKDGLLGDRVVENLRGQLQRANKPMTAESLARLLVQKVQLTPAQARRALADLAAAQESSAAVEELGLAPDTDTAVEDDDIVEPVLDPVTDDDGQSAAELVGGPEQAEPEFDGSDTLETDPEIADLPDAAVGKTIPRRRTGIAAILASLRGRPRQKYTTNRWDSPLMLVGGGGLLVLIAVGILLYFYLLRGTGDDAFVAANESYRQQAYGQAIGQFESFLSDFPKHPKASLARVKIAMARIWGLVDQRQWRDALEAGRTELPRIRDEEAFPEAREELASLLPEIMDGFAEQALAADDIPAAEEQLELANQTLDEVNNSAYLPTSVRRGQQLRIEQIQDKLESVRRRINRDRELESAVAQIGQLASDGKIGEAYDVRDRLLQTYPSVETDPRLDTAVREVAAAERTAVRTLTDFPVPVTDVPPSPSTFRVALAQRRGEPIAALAGQNVIFTTNGAAFGVSAEDGQLRWRYHLGYDSTDPPLALSSLGSPDVIVVRQSQNEIVRLAADTGDLVWRLACGGRVQSPVLSGGNVFVTASTENDATILEIDPTSGQVQRGVRLPVSVTAGPAIDSQARRLVQPAAQASLYVFDLNDFTCQSVTYIGHGQGTISVPPAIADGTVLLAENPGIDFTLLHALEFSENGSGLTPLIKPMRLVGQTVTPLQAVAGRILVATDHGRISVLQQDPNQPESPLRIVAEATGIVSPGTLSYALLDRGRLWVGDNQLTRYELQTSRGQLIRKWITVKGDQFLAPPQLRGDVLFHVRSRANRTGATLAAVAVADQDRILWEVDLAVPSAGTPFIDREAKLINVVSQHGAFYSLDTEAIRSGVNSKPRHELMDPKIPLLVDHVALPEGGRLFVGPASADRVAILTASSDQPRLRTVTLESGAQESIVTMPAPFHQGLLVATDAGLVHVLSPEHGKAMLSPFQPPLGADARIQWQRPWIFENGTRAILADSRGSLFHLGRAEDPQPHVVALNQSQVDTALVRPPVVVGETVFGVVRGGSHDLVRRFDLTNLQMRDQVELPGRAVWGPYPLEDIVLVMTDDGHLVGLTESTQAFASESLPGPAVGQPVPYGEGFVLATVSGAVVHLDRQANPLAVVQLDEAVGSGPVHFSGDRFILCAGDGTLHVVTVQ